jgi:hypothetical protein
MQLKDTHHNAKSDNASTAKATDTKRKHARKHRDAENVHKNMRRENATRTPKLLYVCNVRAPTQHGIVNAQNGTKKKND